MSNAGRDEDREARRALRIRLAAPRGFCAGVERAVRSVEEALAMFGAPVFVRHEIVHNAHVVNRLRSMGAVFVDELGDVVAGRPVILSAHGAPPSVYDEARARSLMTIDATCPLVSKVHNEVRRHVAQGRQVLVIGHQGHPEIVGTMGQAPISRISLITSIADAERISPPPGAIAYATQTTLSLDETAAIIEVLKRRFPAIIGPHRSDICYATQNRQEAVKKIAPGADLVLVVGSAHSSNSRRLVETATLAGAKKAMLVEDPEQFDLRAIIGAAVIGITAGASAPEELVEILLTRIADTTPVSIETIDHVEEDVVFKQPLMLAAG